MPNLNRLSPPKDTSGSTYEKEAVQSIPEVVFNKQDIETGTVESIQRPRGGASGSNTVATWAVTICILCTIVNCLIAFKLPNFGPPSLLEPIFSITREQFRILRQSALVHGFANPVSEETANGIRYPHDLFILNEKGLYHTDGVLSVNRMASTIAQFKAVDFGVEDCEVGLRLTPTVSVNTSITAATELPFSISIYQIEPLASLDKQKSSHSVSPRRLLNVGDITVIPGQLIDWRQSLNCASNEKLALEIACSEGVAVTGCSIEWWQKSNQEDPSNVVFMVEHPVR